MAQNKFTLEQAELVVSKLLDIMTDGASRIKSAARTMPDPTGDGMGFMLAVLSGQTGNNSDAVLSDKEIEKLRTALIDYVLKSRYVEFGADYSIEWPLSEILKNTLGRVPMLLPMKSSFGARPDMGVSMYVVGKSGGDSWTFEQLAVEYKPYNLSRKINEEYANQENDYINLVKMHKFQQSKQMKK